MILRSEWLLDGEGGAVAISSHDSPHLGGWPDAETASKALRSKAAIYSPEPLICGGYETRIANPATKLRERVSFWPDAEA